jgi:hypothetical protein
VGGLFLGVWITGITTIDNPRLIPGLEKSRDVEFSSELGKRSPKGKSYPKIPRPYIYYKFYIYIRNE